MSEIVKANHIRNKRNLKYKNKDCFIKFEKSSFSNNAKLEIYGMDMDVELGIAGILLGYLERGHKVQDIQEIVDKLKQNEEGGYYES